MEDLRGENPINIANLLTVFRMALLPVIVLLFRMGDMSGTLGVYLIAMLSDAADGFIARRFHQVTALGKLLDPLADKLCLLTLLLLFVCDGQIPAWLLAIVLLKEGLMIVGSYAALRMGLVVSALPIGKLTTAAFVLSMIARFLLLRNTSDILLWLSIALSLISLIWYGVVMFGNLQFRQRTI